MPLPIVKADLELRLGVGEVQRFSKGSEAAIDTAIAEAWDSARSAGLNVFTAESWDAMTAESLPPEAKRHIVADACDLLSAGSKRDDQIKEKADEAKLWRSWLAADTVRCFDAVLTRKGTTTVRDGVSYQNPARKLGNPWGDTR